MNERAQPLEPAGRPRHTRPLSPARLIAIAAVSVAFAYQLWLGGQRWGDAIVDCGRELDVPRQLLAGKVLYADVRYWYGPLAPYLNAALYAAFGVRAGVITTAGWVAAALLAVFAYRIIRHVAGRVAAAAGAISVLYVNAFGFYYGVNIFNFVMPYSCPATYGTVLGLASVCSLMRYARRPKLRHLVVSGVLLGLTALTKVEVLFALVVAHAAFIGIGAAGRRVSLKQLLAAYGPAVLIPACTYAWFAARAGAPLWSDNLFVSGNLAANWFTFSAAGLSNIGPLGRQIISGAQSLAGCAALTWIAVLLVERAARGTAETARRAQATVIAAGLLAGLLSAGICIQAGALIILRALSVVLLVLLVIFAFQFARHGRRDGRDFASLLLHTFGLAMLARIILRPGADYYGFYMAVPGVIALAVFWCDAFPGWVSRSAGGHRAACLSGFLVMAGIIWAHQERTQATFRESYESNPPPMIRGPLGALPCPVQHAGSVDRAVAFLAEMPRGTTAVVVPEGSGLTFLAGVINPAGIHTFLPVDFSGGYDDARMVERLATAQPDLVIRSGRDTREYGKEGLGIDYGLRVQAWIQANYQRLRLIDNGFVAVEILQRRNADSPETGESATIPASSMPGEVRQAPPSSSARTRR